MAVGPINPGGPAPQPTTPAGPDSRNLSQDDVRKLQDRLRQDGPQNLEAKREALKTAERDGAPPAVVAKLKQEIGELERNQPPQQAPSQSQSPGASILKTLTR